MYVKDRGTDEERYNSCIYYLKQNNMSFTLTETTGTSLIEYYDKKGNKQKQFYMFDIYTSAADKLKPNYTPNLIPHICRRVLADVKKYLLTNPMPIYDKVRFITRDYDPQLIKTIGVKDIVHEIDINKCYWTYAYNQKFISHKTFIEFLKNKEARLIALGNLAKTTTIIQHIEGKEVWRTSTASQYAAFFYNIICAIAEIYSQVNQNVGRKIFYFQTDAFLVQPSLHIERKVREVLDMHNFDFKINRFKVTDFTNSNLTITNLMPPNKQKTFSMCYN